MKKVDCKNHLITRRYIMLKAKKNPWLMLTVASLLSYLLFGLFDSLKGSTLSNLLEDMN